MEKGRDGSADDRNKMRKNALFIGILFISADLYLPSPFTDREFSNVR